MIRHDRYVVLGVAHARSAWFNEVSRWATAGAAPVEFVKCVSAEEVLARLASGRPVSALLADAGRVGLDRDVIDVARRAGCAVIVVDDGRTPRDWFALGAHHVLTPEFNRRQFLDALGAFATAIGRVDHDPPVVAELPDTAWRGRLVAVTGTGGSGASTVAMGLAQAFGADARHRGMVLLADLALDADQAMLHDARDVLPGVPELVDACRSGVADAAVDDVTFRLDDRGYDLLLGLRRHRDWTALRPRAFEAALDAVRRRYRLVVADVDPDVEGEDETGSTDVADRNHMARHTMWSADAVLVVATPTAHGTHSLVRRTQALLQLGVEPSRLVAVVNHTGRSPRRRAQLTRAYAELAAVDGGTLSSPLFASGSRRVDDAVTRGAPLPDTWCRPLGTAVLSLLERVGPRPAHHVTEPDRIAPGSLGSWSVHAGGAA